MHCILLELLQDVEIPPEGDFVPFKDEMAIKALEIVLFLMLLLPYGEFDFGSYSFVDYSRGYHGVIPHDGDIITDL